MLVVLLLIYVNVELSLSVLYACKQDIFSTYQRRSTIVLYCPLQIETIKQCFYSCQYTTPPINNIHMNMINRNGSYLTFQHYQTIQVYDLFSQNVILIQLKDNLYWMYRFYNILWLQIFHSKVQRYMYYHKYRLMTQCAFKDH